MEIKNNYNNENGMARNDNISDRVFCLSEYEVMTYFSDKYSRRAGVTDYAMKKVDRSDRKWFMDARSCTGNYWLRTLKCEKSFVMAMYVNYDGILRTSVVGNAPWLEGIRPALWLNLEGFVASEKMFDR